jgi:hypothetical protein
MFNAPGKESVIDAPDDTPISRYVLGKRYWCILSRR